MPSELELIDRFVAAFDREAPGLVVGPGDDAAVLRARSGRDLLATVDAVVEGVHFAMPPFSAEDVGHKALAVNLSDIAAMGGEPRWFLVSVELPPERVALLDDLARGMAALARAAGAALAGGNFSRATKLALSVTVLGEVPRGRALGRGGASVGDLVFLAGAVGDAALGLRLPALSAAQRRPTPRLRAGVLARAGGATAAIDVSDGLVRDLSHLARASGVRVRVDAARLPLSKTLVERAGAEALALALAGGEDYALAFTAPPGRARALARAFARAQEPLALVGECTGPGDAVTVLGPDGDEIRVAPTAGWDHFA